MTASPAAALAHVLDGRKAGATWMARCPAHEDREPSLSITDSKNGKVLVRCHAGCHQADVIATLRERGVWETTTKATGPFMRIHQRRIPNEPIPDSQKRTAPAIAIWQAAQAVDGTLVATYLRARVLSFSPLPSIRFHAGLMHPSGGVWPAMVALVTCGMDGAPIAIHRTFLAHDGNGKAPVEPSKMMLGPCRGGAVRLAHPSDVLMIGEGIETCLAAIQATGRPAWAALSTSGMRSLELPINVREVIVLADGDKAGESAARAAALRWIRQGRCVRIAHPVRGLDFNDMLLGDLRRIRQGAVA